MFALWLRGGDVTTIPVNGDLARALRKLRRDVFEPIVLPAVQRHKYAETPGQRRRRKQRRARKAAARREAKREATLLAREGEA